MKLLTYLIPLGILPVSRLSHLTINMDSIFVCAENLKGNDLYTKFLGVFLKLFHHLLTYTKISKVSKNRYSEASYVTQASYSWG